MKGTGLTAAGDRTGVLVMAHGTPSSPDELEAFYTRIRRGRPPSAEQLADLRRRYEAIGGTSPLAERTRAQVEGLRRALDRSSPGRFLVAFGAKHTEPSIETAAGELADAGVSTVIGLVLTPHPSSLGSAEYLQRAADTLAARRPAVRFVAVAHWYGAPGFVEVMAGAVRDALAAVSPPAGSRCTVLFTAHSLPERVVAGGDRYPEHVARSASLIAAAAGVTDWRVAWQSAGRTPEPWIGPDLAETLRGLPAGGIGAVVVCPVGFTADHLEVLYDLDIEARAVAGAAGLAFARTRTANDDPRFLEALAGVVRDADPGLVGQGAAAGSRGERGGAAHG